MEFKIENQPVFTTLTIKLRQTESVKAEAGAMVSMSPTIDLKAKKAGKGVLGTIKASIGGESFFSSLFTAQEGAGEVVLAPATPGDIIQFDLQEQTVYAQSGAYLAGTDAVELSTKGSLKAMISGEGLFLQKLSGSGTVFLSSYGSINTIDLKPGEHYIVDTGHMLAFEESITYKIKKASKGLFSTLASGEGLVCNFEGPGKLWTQSRNLSGFASLIQKLIQPKRKEV